MAKKHYFDNEAVSAAILVYQKTKDRRVLHPFTKQLTDLIRGVINTHRIYRFHNDLNELIQEAFVALYASIDRFDPSKGSAFNYLSIVVKQYLKNWTRSQNNKRNRNSEFQDSYYVAEDQNGLHMASFEFFDNLELPIQYEGLVDDLNHAVGDLHINNYQDMIKWLQEKGWKPKDVKKAFKIIQTEYVRRA